MDDDVKPHPLSRYRKAMPVTAFTSAKDDLLYIE